MPGSGGNSTHGSAVMPLEMPPVAQCLPLEPITLGNKKYTRSGELRRALRVPSGSTWKNNFFRDTHSKPSPPVATGELKNIKDSVQNSSDMARDRLKLLDKNIFKLDKYTDAVKSKKRQRSDQLSTNGLGVTKLTKIGSQIHKSNCDSMPQRSEERAKNVGPNKSACRSAMDGRENGRPSTISRHHMFMEKDEDTLYSGNGLSVQLEEKIHKLPTSDEGWDKKVKKKRSIGVVSKRVINADQDVKQAMQAKIGTDSKLRSGDAQGFRLKSSAGIYGIKLEGSFEQPYSNAGTVSRNEPVVRGHTAAIKQRVVIKSNDKSNIREDNPVLSPSTIIKSKISQVPRTGSAMVLDSFRNLETWSKARVLEQPTITNKVQASGQEKNPNILTSTGLSSYPMTQWACQRPHNSRMRRSNLISSAPDHVETRISAVGIATSDARTSSVETNGSLLASSGDNETPKFKRKRANVSSPVGLSESEESRAGEETYSGEVTKSVVHRTGTFALPTRKNKVRTNDIGDGVHRQERTGRCSSLTRPGIPPWREKLENASTSKPVQTIRPSSDKSKSKSGRPPSKKLKHRKAVTQVGSMVNAASSGYTGGSDDDQEELYAAANSARNASNVACSGPFWKKMLPIFAPVSSEDVSYLKQQLSFAEELDGSLSAVFGSEYNVLGLHKEAAVCSTERQESQSNQGTAQTDACEISNKVTPLYQRILSALIEEDENEEFYHHAERKSMSLQYVSDDSHCGSCNQVDSEPKEKDQMEFEIESRVNYQKKCLSEKFSCDKHVASNLLRSSASLSSLCSNEKWLGDDDILHSSMGLVNEICQNDLCQRQPGKINGSGLSSSASQYQHMSLDDRLMLELESIGLYPETLPDLAEEEVINQDIMELKEELYQQVGKKKKNLGKISKAIENGRDKETWNMEQVAMDQLIEMANRKQLACCGGKALKSAARKVSRQSALAFVKRNLARCRKYEATGSSCFREPKLRDAIFSAPHCNNDAKSVNWVGSGTASNTYNEASYHQDEARGSGAVSSPLKRYDPRNDNLDRGSENEIFKRQPLDRNIMGGNGFKGKRSQRGNGLPKTQPKPKLKNNHMLNADNGSHGRLEAVDPANRVRPTPPRGDIGQDSCKVVEEADMELHELDRIELGVSNAPQDLSSWLNFDEDGLQDHDSIGLEIPMDDLSDLMLM